MKQKVLILHLAHWDQLMGGAEQQLKYLSNFLSNKGYEVHIICLKQNDKQIEKTEIISHLIPYTALPGTFGQTFFRYKKVILKKVKEINPDIFITRGFTSWAGITAEIAKKNNKIHLHFTASDNEVVRDEKTIPIRRFFNKIELGYFIKIYNKHTRLITQNSFQKKKILNKYNIESKIITQAAPAPKHQINDKVFDVIKVVWIANLKPIKGPEKFLEVVEYFKDFENVKFTMIGRSTSNLYSEMLNELSQQINFEFLGELSNDKVNEVLRMSHILVNTSDYEGFSNTFVQAWLRGVIIVSLNSNPDKILTYNKIGYHTESLTKTKEVIESLLNNKVVLKEKGEASRKYALEAHIIDKTFTKISFK